MNNSLTKKKDIKKWLIDNMVVILFAVLSIVGMIVSGSPVSNITNEVFTRFARNTCLVLALIIPCLAGLGMNFGIVAGAIAAQISIFFVVHFGGTGLTGFLLCILVSTPLAILFGYCLGLIFNKTKGAEMVAGLIFGFFADGLYKLFVLYIIGGVIPFDDPNLLDRGFGLKNTFDLTENIGYALDNISFFNVLRVLFVLMILAAAVSIVSNLKTKAVPIKTNLVKIIGAAVGFGLTYVIDMIPYFHEILGGKRLILTDAIRVLSVVGIVYFAAKLIINKVKGKKAPIVKSIVIMAIAVVLLVLTFFEFFTDITKMVRLSASSYGVICLFCFLNNWILSTKLGQDMRTVGQSRAVATSAGINVDKIRIIATCFSTVLAAWGQLVYLQNLGTFNTVQQQTNVGLYAVAAILVGGASVRKATNKQAIIGIILFHALFVVAPLAATKLVGDSAIAEYIRMFISYGVIAVALAMHAWDASGKKKKKEQKAVEA